MNSSKRAAREVWEERHGRDGGVYAVYADSKELPTPLSFPVDALPKQSRQLVREASAAIGCPPDFVALPMLVELGSTIGNSRRIRLKEGWTESSALYAAVVADPGEKKTPAYKVAVEPAIKRQAALKEEYHQKRDEYERELREYEVDKRVAVKDGHAAPPPPQPPAMGRTVVEDTTIEALAAVLEHDKRGVLVVRDELAAWVRSMNQYRASGRGADRQFWLSAWSNSYASVDRKSRPEPLILQAPFVGVFGTIQPGVLPELGEGREDGLLDRILFAYPNPVPSRWTDDEISASARSAARWLCDRLRKLHMPEDDYGDPNPACVALSHDAKAVIVELINAHREEMEQPGFPARLKEPWSKLEAYLARLALIIAMCRVVDADAPERIEAEDVLRASVLLDYFKNHARRVYVGLYGEDHIDGLADDVAKFLEDHGGSWQGQPAELHSLLKSNHKLGRAKDLSAALSTVVTRFPALLFDREGHEAFTKEDGTRTTRRVWKLLLRNSVNSVNSVNNSPLDSAYSPGRREGDLGDQDKEEDWREEA